MTSRPPIGVLFGTRPEAIKLAPVILELGTRGIPTTVITTGQHRDLIEPVLQVFGIKPDHDLQLMRHGAGLDYLLSAAVVGVGHILAETRPAALVVQGDTTSTLAATLAAFHAGVPVAHVEAGLRSRDMALPFPEEMNRRVVSVIARWHFAPTERAAENLRAEGHAESVIVTGNTVVDAVRHIGRSPLLPGTEIDVSPPYILATAHRRESWGQPIEQIALALRDVLEAQPDVSLVFTTHPNPMAKGPVTATLGGIGRAHITDAVDYVTFIHLLEGAVLAVSDSGGVQEEGPTLGVPVLVTREVTERPEGVDAGAVRLVGTDRARIRDDALLLLTDADERARMAEAGRTVYGDGQAARRIADVLALEALAGAGDARTPEI
jgi:UDP-N-acetylglucosamine 2-epimerase (non-hydrolysing)